METYTYHGGWLTVCDPWYDAYRFNWEKEIHEAFGVPISGWTWSEKITNWTRAASSDAWTLTWWRFQMGLENFKDMDEVNEFVEELILWPAEDYDKLANDTLEFFFKKLNSGKIVISPYWGLEVMMREINEE